MSAETKNIEIEDGHQKLQFWHQGAFDWSYQQVDKLIYYEFIYMSLTFFFMFSSLKVHVDHLVNFHINQFAALKELNKWHPTELKLA